MSGLRVILGALVGFEFVAIPCAIVYGNHGPAWPLVPAAFSMLVGGFIGYRVPS